MTMFCGVAGFRSTVYTTAYPTKVAAVSHIVRGFTAFHRIARPRPPTAPDIRMICAGVIVPITVGRPRVRAMTASIFCSTRQLNAAAAPATSAMPMVAARTSPAGGSVGEASSMPITAVKTMSDTTRGLVRRQNCTGTAAASGVVTWVFIAKPAILLDRLADLRSLQQAVQVLVHAPQVRIRRPPQHHVPVRIGEIDVPAVVAGASRQRRAHDLEPLVPGRRAGGGIVDHQH